MKVYLDENGIGDTIGSVEEAIATASELTERAARVVIEVSADGAPIDPQLLDAPPADDAGIRELRFVSAPLGAFVKTTLLDAVPLLDAIAADAQEAADHIQAGQPEDAFEPMERAREAWAVIHELTHKSSELLGHPLPEGKIEEGDRVLAESLMTIKRCVETQDWGGLSDELAYDTRDRVDTWRTLIGDLADRAAR